MSPALAGRFFTAGFPFTREATSFPPVYEMGFPHGSVVKNLPANAGMQVQSLGREDALEKEETTRSSIFAWEIPWTEEPGGLQSRGLQRVRHDWVTKNNKQTKTYESIYGHNLENVKLLKK